MAESVRQLERALEASTRRVDELCAENERLRGLVRDMCEWAYIDSCCSLHGEFADRMRELGVEE